MTTKEIDKLWYEYSAGNNPYADYQSFVAGFKACSTKGAKPISDGPIILKGGQP